MIFPHAWKHTSLYIISVWNIGHRNIGTYWPSGCNHGLTTVKALARWIAYLVIYKCRLTTIPFLRPTYLYTWFREVLCRDCPTWHEIDIEWILTAKSIFTTRSFLILFEILFRISTRQTLDFSTGFADRKDIVIPITSGFKTPHHSVFSFLAHTWSSPQLTVEVAQDASSGKAAHVWVSYKPENNTKYSWVNVCIHVPYQFY